MNARFRSDAFWSAVGTLLPMLIGAATVPMLLRILNGEGFTAYALGLAIISFAPSLDFGIARALFRRVAAASGTNQKEAWGLTSWAIVNSAKVGLVAALVMGGALGSLSALSLIPAASVERAWLAVVVALVGVAPAIVANTQRAALEGAGRFGSSARAKIGLGVLSAVVPAALALVTQDVAILCGSLVLLRVSTVVQQHRILRREGLLPFDWRSLGYSWSDDQRFWRESRWYALLAPASLLMSGFDRFVVMAVSSLTLAQLAVFIAPQEIALKAIILPAAIIPAVVVRMAVGTTASERARLLAQSMLHSICFLTLLFCIIGSLLAPQIATFLFRSLDTGVVSEVIQIFAVGIFSNAVAQFPMASLSARALIRYPALLQMGQLPVYLGALHYLIGAYGVIGAAWAWSGRIVVDTVLLSLFSHLAVPQLRIRGLHLIHVGGVTILLLVMGMHRFQS